MEESLSKKSKRVCFPIVFDLDESALLDDKIVSVLDEEEENDLRPGFNCCGVCAEHRDLVPCEECSRVMLCPSCVSKHTGNKMCSVLSAIHAVEQEEDKVDVSTTVKMMQSTIVKQPVSGWNKMFEHEASGEELARIWLASEVLSGPLALKSALTSHGLKGVLTNLQKKGGKVHLVGVEDEMVDTSPWQWLWKDVLRASNVTCVGIGPEITDSQVKQPDFETHACRYEELRTLN